MRGGASAKNTGKTRGVSHGVGPVPKLRIRHGTFAPSRTPGRLGTMVAISEWFERERARQEIRELEDLARQLLARSSRLP
jgi:hypothetical protein